MIWASRAHCACQKLNTGSFVVRIPALAILILPKGNSSSILGRESGRSSSEELGNKYLLFSLYFIVVDTGSWVGQDKNMFLSIIANMPFS